MLDKLDSVLLRSYDGRSRPVRLGERIGAGAGGTVWLVQEYPGLLVKLSHNPLRQRLHERISALWEAGPGWAADRNRLRAAWPYAMALHPETSELRGYAMPQFARPDYYELDQTFGSLSALGFRDPTWAQRVRMAVGVARTTAVVNERRMVVADLSPENIFVTEAGTASLVDMDGWQVRDPRGDKLIECQGSRDEVTPPEHLGQDDRTGPREPTSDRWSLAIVIGRVLFAGTHPYAGIRAGEPPHWDEADHVRQRMCWLLDAGLSVPPGTPPLRILSSRLYRLFEACFEAGYERPHQRPTPEAWADALQDTHDGLKSCDRNELHLYPAESRTCPWCAVERRGDRKDGTWRAAA